MLPSINSSCCGSMFKLLEVRSTAPYSYRREGAEPLYNPRSISSLNNNLVFNKNNVIETHIGRLQNTRVSPPVIHRTRSPSLSDNDRSS